MPMSKIKNVAIIMDGNGRWAQERGKPRIWGHIRGSSKVSGVVERACQMGLRSLTLYAFSTENWSRPEGEINLLFKLLVKFLRSESKKILSNQIRFRVIGDRENLPSAAREMVAKLEHDTKHLTGMQLNLALSYGGRHEIIRAFNNWLKVNPGKLEISEHELLNHFYASDLPEVDLVIRTGGDQRISNFLIWQCAYAEIYFTSSPWPEICPDQISQIIGEVEQRERRFGFVSSVESLAGTKRLAQEQLKKLREAKK